MDEIMLEGGTIICDCRKKSGIQESLEVKLVDGRIVLLTATPTGKIRIGLLQSCSTRSNQPERATR